MKQSTKTIILMFTLAVIALSVPIFKGMFVASVDRIEQEHGLLLPSSAIALECRSFGLKRFDGGAAATFSMDQGAVASFVGQLTITDTKQGPATSIFPGNIRSDMRTHWAHGEPLTTYGCKSSAGDYLKVQTFPLEADRMGVCLYTDWN
jgi:hypothetical protein